MKKLLALLRAKGATSEEISEIEAELEADREAAKKAEVEGLKKKKEETEQRIKSLEKEVKNPDSATPPPEK